jgi:hypothetical protein
MTTDTREPSTVQLKCIQINDLEEILTVNEKEADIFIFNIPVIPSEVCKNNTKLSHLIFTDKVLCISQFAFQGCSNLKTIQFSRCLQRIENFAFADCPQLDCDLVLPANIIAIGTGAFSRSFIREKRDGLSLSASKNLLFVSKDALRFNANDKDKRFGYHFEGVEMENFEKLKLSSTISTQEKLGYLIQGFVIDTFEKMNERK